MAAPEYVKIVKSLQTFLNEKDKAGLDVDGQMGGKTLLAAQAYERRTSKTRPAASWRLAKSLEVLRLQVDTSAPNRSKVADGTIGDAAHATRKSDHNPWVKDANGTPVVTALDITHDPNDGVDCALLAEALILDPRTKYVIFAGKIYNASVARRWRPYDGPNKHHHHLHISVEETQKHFDDTTPWRIK